MTSLYNAMIQLSSGIIICRNDSSRIKVMYIIHTFYVRTVKKGHHAPIIMAIPFMISAIESIFAGYCGNAISRCLLTLTAFVTFVKSHNSTPRKTLFSES